MRRDPRRCAHIPQEKIKSRFKCLAGVLFRERKESFWTSRNPRFPWITSWSCCSRRKRATLSRLTEAAYHTRMLLDEQKKPTMSEARSELNMQELRVESVDRALHEPGLQLHSQRMQLHQANQLSAHSERENRIGYTEEKLSSRGSYEKSSGHRRIEQIVLYRSWKSETIENRWDFFSKEKSLSTVNQLTVQIQELQSEFIPWTIPRSSLILKRQAVLDYSTFPVILWVLRSLEEYLAAIRACRMTHGTHMVHGETVLKIHLHWMIRQLPERMNWKDIPHIVQYRHRDLQWSFQLESSISCRRSLSSVLHGWTTKESSLRNAFRYLSTSQCRKTSFKTSRGTYVIFQDVEMVESADDLCRSKRPKLKTNFFVEDRLRIWSTNTFG